MRSCPSRPTTNASTCRPTRTSIMCGGAGSDRPAFALAQFLHVDRLRDLYVIPRSIIRPSARVVHAGVRTAAFRLPATLFALREVFVALRIGTVDRPPGVLATRQAGRDDGRIHRVDLDGYPFVEHITLAF